MSARTQTLKGEQYLVTHSVGYQQAGIRLDRFLMQRYRKRSREQLKRAIDSGAVTIRRKGAAKHLLLGRIKPSFALQGGDIVEMLSIRRPEPEVNFNYQILFEDEHLVVIHKPANLPVHPAGRYFFNTLLVHLKTQGFTNALESERSFFLVHRIDKETSGVLLLAKTREACNALTTQFRNRETEKYYLAVTHGSPEKDQFVIDTPIGKILGSAIGLKMFALPEEKGGYSALTHFEKIETRTDANGRNFSLLACFPRTGRQHQIRVHADLAGVPLVGDKIYGLDDDYALSLIDGYRDHVRSEVSPEPLDEELVDDLLPTEAPEDDEDSFHIPGPTVEQYPEMQAKLLIKRHALHAAGLKFKHPVSGKDMVFETSLPDDLKEFFEAVNGQAMAPFKTKHW